MDRPGIIQAVTEVMVGHNITITELSTSSMETPMAGGFLFRATAILAVADDLDTSQLHQDLEGIANDLLVELHEDHT
jgi:glycine cleavage system regulatory protein